LSCSQELVSGLYHEPDALVHTFPFCFCNVYVNIILPLVSRSAVWSLSFKFSHQNPLLIWSLKWCFVKSTDHKAPHCAVFLSLLLSPQHSAPSM